MQTSWFTETLRSDLEAVGSLGSDKAMKVADRMITVALPLAKARMLEAMSMALTELSGALGIERIDLRVSGDDVTFVPAEATSEPRTADPTAEQARFSLRLPDDLKARIDSRADAEGTSTNTWIVRALETAVGRGGGPHSPRSRRLSGYGHA
jgi:HicB-like protein involved in pilus formation